MSTILAPHPVYGSYPPNPDTSLSTFDVTSKLKNNHSVDYGRNISRTPSPTPEEYNLLHGIKPVQTTQQKISEFPHSCLVVRRCLIGPQQRMP